MSTDANDDAIQARFFQNKQYLVQNWNELSEKNRGRFVVIAAEGAITNVFSTERQATDFRAGLDDPLDRASALVWFFELHVARQAYIG